MPITVRIFGQWFSAARRGARLLAEHQFTVWGIPRGTDAFDAARLTAAGLTSNAVLHGPVPGRDFELVLGYGDAGGILRIEVSDMHPAPPVPLVSAAPDPEEECGRGLLLVEALASRWGVRRGDGPGRTVWAEIGLRTAPEGVLGPAAAVRGADRQV
ncbi:MAG TPA: ATP-binding protein [Streptomyces sp.]|nr:ATP-binding protein [Streptomyces sp.]